jgi:hypothetical protein
MTALVVRRSQSLIEEFERMFESTLYRPLLCQGSATA